MATWTDDDLDGSPDADEAYYASHDECVAYTSNSSHRYLITGGGGSGGGGGGGGDGGVGGGGLNCTTDCLPCTGTWKYEDSGGTNCNATGVTLETLPVQEGFYRQGAFAHYVRPCVVASICRGGEDYDDQCLVCRLDAQTGD